MPPRDLQKSNQDNLFKAEGDKLAATITSLGNILKARMEAPLYRPFINHQLYGMYCGLDIRWGIIVNMKKKLILPRFKNEDQERDFWSEIDLSEYFEPKDFVPVSFPNLKPTTRPISLRVPEYIIDRVKEKANAINIPYQSLMKQYIEKGAFAS